MSTAIERLQGELQGAQRLAEKARRLPSRFSEDDLYEMHGRIDLLDWQISILEMAEAKL